MSNRAHFKYFNYFTYKPRLSSLVDAFDPKPLVSELPPDIFYSYSCECSSFVFVEGLVVRNKRFWWLRLIRWRTLNALIQCHKNQSLQDGVSRARGSIARNDNDQRQREKRRGRKGIIIFSITRKKWVLVCPRNCFLNEKKDHFHFPPGLRHPLLRSSSERGATFIIYLRRTKGSRDPWLFIWSPPLFARLLFFLGSPEEHRTQTLITPLPFDPCRGVDARFTRLGEIKPVGRHGAIIADRALSFLSLSVYILFSFVRSQVRNQGRSEAMVSIPQWQIRGRRGTSVDPSHHL